MTHEFLEGGTESTESVIKICMMAFPSIWYDEEPEVSSAAREFRVELDEELFRFFLKQQHDEGQHTEELHELRRLFRLHEFSSIFYKLKSFYSDPCLRISNNDINHTMIATVLILEYTCVLFASPSHPSLGKALDNACSQFISSGTHNAINRLFLLYSTQQLTEFILTHRLR